MLRILNDCVEISILKLHPLKALVEKPFFLELIVSFCELIRKFVLDVFLQRYIDRTLIIIWDVEATERALVFNHKVGI